MSLPIETTPLWEAHALRAMVIVRLAILFISRSVLLKLVLAPRWSNTGIYGYTGEDNALISPAGRDRHCTAFPANYLRRLAALQWRYHKKRPWRMRVPLSRFHNVYRGTCISDERSPRLAQCFALLVEIDGLA
jgi:hypothetical protein